jgi:phosphoglycolate phosphatase
MTRLIVFDCDGTLVDSQHVIIEAMGLAFAAEGLRPPPDEAVRAVVGLSLAVAIAQLLPEPEAADCLLLAERYQAAFHAIRQRPDFHEPLFEGAGEALGTLAQAGFTLAIATGKGIRGLTAVLEHHGLADLFSSLQTADQHPSKPHPAMVEAAMREAGSTPASTWLVGDTSYDILMARAAGVRPIGVAWGYHPVEALRAAGAAVILERFDQLHAMLDGPAA